MHWSFNSWTWQVCTVFTRNFARYREVVLRLCKRCGNNKNLFGQLRQQLQFAMCIPHQFDSLRVPLERKMLRVTAHQKKVRFCSAKSGSCLLNTDPWPNPTGPKMLTQTTRFQHCCKHSCSSLWVAYLLTDVKYLVMSLKINRCTTSRTQTLCDLSVRNIEFTCHRLRIMFAKFWHSLVF